MFTARINVMPLKELLDPQGKAVKDGLKNLDINVVDVRIGKHITLQVDAETEQDAKNIAEEATRKLLANPVMEQFEVEIEKLISTPDWNRLSKGGA